MFKCFPVCVCLCVWACETHERGKEEEEEAVGHTGVLMRQRGRLQSRVLSFHPFLCKNESPTKIVCRRLASSISKDPLKSRQQWKKGRLGSFFLSLSQTAALNTRISQRKNEFILINCNLFLTNWKVKRGVRWSKRVCLTWGGKAVGCVRKKT